MGRVNLYLLMGCARKINILFLWKLNAMTADETARLFSDLSELKSETKQITQTLKIVDKRLSLIEQRLANIKPRISVDK